MTWAITKYLTGFSLFFISTGLVLAVDVPAPIVLSPQAIGSFPLAKGATVSESRLRKAFPSYVVGYEIRSGDSPDFHHFKVATKTGEILFEVKSFFKDPPGTGEKTTAEVPIDLLQVYSPKIKDNYGLKVGDRVADIVRVRGKNLKFGAGHFDALMGDSEIYYRLIAESQNSPENFRKDDALKGNWRIRTISWPVAAWE